MQPMLVEQRGPSRRVGEALVQCIAVARRAQADPAREVVIILSMLILSRLAADVADGGSSGRAEPREPL
jgi:hypothetical protein